MHSVRFIASFEIIETVKSKKAIFLFAIISLEYLFLIFYEDIIKILKIVCI